MNQKVDIAALLMNSALPLCAEVERLREVERLALTLVTASATARDCAETFMRRRRVEESPPLSVCHEWPEHAAMTAAWAAEREAMSALTAAVRR